MPPSSSKRRLLMTLPLLSTNCIGSGPLACRALSLIPRMQRCGHHTTKHMRCVRYMSSSDAEHDASTSRQEHTITFRSSAGKPDISFSATDGEILRTACLRRGLVSPHNGNARLINCRGLGTCGTCAVEIEGSTADVPPPIEPAQRNNVENLRLQFPPHGSTDQSPKLRLACQVQVRGDVVVTKRAGFWGQASKSGVGEDDVSDDETMVVRRTLASSSTCWIDAHHSSRRRKLATIDSGYGNGRENHPLL